MSDNYSAIWLSNSSINDFLKCPKAYYLHNVYKNPKTGNKISIINPSLALGQVVHEVIESLSLIPAEAILKTSLLLKLDSAWEQIRGRKGGFKSIEEEEAFKHRGRMMIQRIIDNPNIILNKALRLTSPDTLPPRYLFSHEHNILLCGKIDWLEYIPEDDSVHIVDFKTGKNYEDSQSLQLSIYCLLVQNCQKRTIKKLSYWYLDKENSLTAIPIPNCEEIKKDLLAIALRIKKARSTKIFPCIKGECFACRPYNAVINGEAEFVGTRGYQDLYFLN